MTIDDIIRMAREAKCAIWEDGSVSPALERFAKLVAAAERDACAQVSDQLADEWNDNTGVADSITRAIRARGQE